MHLAKLSRLKACLSACLPACLPACELCPLSSGLGRNWLAASNGKRRLSSRAHNRQLSLPPPRLGQSSLPCEWVTHWLTNLNWQLCLAKRSLALKPFRTAAPLAGARAAV